jgi:hypothetical protein
MTGHAVTGPRWAFPERHAGGWLVLSIASYALGQRCGGWPAWRFDAETVELWHGNTT